MPAGDATQTTFEIQPFVDASRLRAFHWRVLALCTAALFIDGFDIFIVGKVAPAIAAGFGQPVAAMTPVFLLTQLGLALGAFGASPLADRFGRKRTMVWSVTCFAIFTLLAPLSRSIVELAVLRFFAGIFLSGILPMAVSLVAEYTPKARRGMFIGIVLAGYSTGAAAGGAVAAWFLDPWGWPAAFWIGGGLPVLLLPLLLWALPESLQFLANRGGKPEAIIRGLRRVDPSVQVPAAVTFVAGDMRTTERGTGPAALLTSERRRTTIFIWAATFLAMGSNALLGAWLPSFFNQMAGVPIQKFAVVIMIGFSGGLVGTLSAGLLMDRFAPTRLIPVTYLGLAVALFMLGRVPFGTAEFTALIMFYSFCQSGGQAMLNTLQANSYPAQIRGTGIGWAGGMGRVGGIIAPLLGGFVLAQYLELGLTMLLAALLPLGTALMLLGLPRKRAI